MAARPWADRRRRDWHRRKTKSSLKGNSPGPGEYVWDTTHLGFNAWSERRRIKLSCQYFSYW